MRVFNLTDGNIDFRGKTIPAYGSQEYRDLKFVLPREMDLQRSGMLSFGKLPKDWKRPQPKQAPSPIVEAVKAAVEPPKPVLVTFTDTVKVEEVLAPPEEAPQEESRKEKRDKWKK